MRKTIVITCLTAMLLMLSGCEEGHSPSTPGYSSKYNVPDISILAKDTGHYNYFYVIDNNTGVVYLQFDGFRRAGITVALNADGTPVTVDQIRMKWVEE